MRIRENVGFLLLAIWLILEGLVTLTGIGGIVVTVIMGILALVAGVIFLLIYWRRV